MNDIRNYNDTNPVLPNKNIAEELLKRNLQKKGITQDMVHVASYITAIETMGEHLRNYKRKLRSMTLKEILNELGAKGLVCDGVDCGCGMDDLCPCGCDPFECKPAKEIVATQEDIDELNTEAEVGDLLYQGFPFYNEEEK